VKLFCTLYLDEDVSVMLGYLLDARGFDVTTARDQGMLGKSDEEQLAYSASKERCLLTHNRADFERLHKFYITTDKRHGGTCRCYAPEPLRFGKACGSFA
jgi:predicted nuclease of predicted toxin-antitoxin system